MEGVAVPLAEGGQEPRVLGQLPDPDVIDLAEFLHVALATLRLPENEESKLIHPEKVVSEKLWMCFLDGLL